MTVDRDDHPSTLLADRTRRPALALPEAPATATSGLRGAAARVLFERVARRLPIVVDYGPSDTRTRGDLPTMTITEPDAFFRRIGSDGLIGLGESYMAGEWTADDLVGVLVPFAERIGTVVPPSLQRLRRLLLPTQPSDEENSVDNTRSNISRHYDLSNDLFALFLDETLTYSSAHFGSDEQAAVAEWVELADAQRAKIDRLLDHAQVGAGTRVLEIGTGWGELALRAAARGATVRSVTLSAEQRAHALRRAREADLSDRIRVDLLDYRAVDGEYDAVVSVEMIEAVGMEYWPVYFETVERLLAPGGRAAIQAITMPHDRMLSSARTYTWIHKYIFPGGQIPSGEAMRDAAASAGLQFDAVEEFGMHYARTLQLWRERFEGQWPLIADLGFDETFRRMWTFYLAYSEAGFAARYLDVVHLRFVKNKN
ncbi:MULTISPECIES: SAM-dependent methyltransferase [Gordonia]|jgi:cyclopropane-fatty-acyl-phospholipid synthase|uniref:Cyclopropane fatty acid synthase n=1 Tax=Gordonia malaquae NBRC 108250 TaxID=1223542 RepID=M3VD88_GORML|nr:cyclopropane-fatty-acyl-phospholipid synthase family protein [Gordonia malaquae]GAC78239.1 cyclopropane fatty acid synthase [Gordonia malaquae NBRC 108250]SED99378.1 cyclopropane-fatty-acyl-phospholipid synthase [Gordonia malaquae]